MTMQRPHFTNIRGNMVEFAADFPIQQDRHNHREVKSQKVQYKTTHQHGTRKDVKIPFKRKMT